MSKGVLSRVSPTAFVILAALVVSIVTPKAALTDGLVSHWPLNIVTPPAIAPDDVGQNNFTVVGFQSPEAGQEGNAFRFNGTNNYLIRRHDADRTVSGGLPIYTAGAHTISMWVKGPAQTARYLFSHGSTNSNNPLFILQTGQAAGNGGKLDVVIRNDGNATLVNHVVSDTVVFDDTWHHITWVDDNGAVRLYVDAVPDPANFSYTPSGTFTFNTTAIATLARAAISATAIFNGLIDDVRVWERALTPEEVYELVPDIAPVITREPADVTRANGDWARFSVTHTGTGPFTYQWYRNGVEIPGANSRQYLATNLTPANTGETFYVRLNNAAGGATSREASLTVLADPSSDLRAGLVNYWPLDVIDSTDTFLTSEDLYSGNDMVLVNFASASDVVPGKFGNALDFDGARYTYRTNGAPIYSTTNYSISMWVQGDFTGQTDRRVFSEGSTNNNNPLFTLGTDNQGTT